MHFFEIDWKPKEIMSIIKHIFEAMKEMNAMNYLAGNMDKSACNFRQFFNYLKVFYRLFIWKFNSESLFEATS